MVYLAKDMATWYLAVDGTVLNLFLTYNAWRFYRERSEETARRLFLFSNLHLPLLLILFMLHKKRNLPPFEHDDPVVKCHDAIMEANDNIVS